jgi:hypothetical protein
VFLTSGDTVTENAHRWPVKKVLIFFNRAENGPYYKAARAAAGTGKAVTLHGGFLWNHHFEFLSFVTE